MTQNLRKYYRKINFFRPITSYGPYRFCLFSIFISLLLSYLYPISSYSFYSFYSLYSLYSFYSIYSHYSFYSFL